MRRVGSDGYRSVSRSRVELKQGERLVLQNLRTHLFQMLH